MRCLALILICFCTPGLLSTRIWTDIHGRKLEASYQSQDAESVTVLRELDQRSFQIPKDQLSPADLAFVAEQKVARSKLQRPSATSFPKDGLDWPRRVSADEADEIKIITEDNSTGEYVYQSPHFEFHSDVKLARKVVREFAAIFESTLALLQTMPLGWDIQVPQEHFQARLYETETSYLAAGGVEGSAGIYRSSDRIIYVRLDALATKKTSSSLSLDEGSHRTLIHEITHQVQHDWLRRMPVWLIEGFAEYTERIPFDRGQFRLDRIELDTNRIRNIQMIAPKTLMQMRHQEWSDAFIEGQIYVSRQYLSAYLLTYYFLYLDGDGDGRRFWQYLRALVDDRVQPEEVLLEGRSYEQLSEAIQAAYKAEDIEIEFY